MHGIARLSISRSLRFLPRLHHHSAVDKQWQYEELTSRSLLKAQGKDSKELLQGLTTNDLTCLDKDCAVIYSLILNVKGRVLYDALIYKLASEDDDPTYLVECDASIAADLLKHIKMYKLRKKVRLSNESGAFRLWALLPGLEPEVPSSDRCRPAIATEVDPVCIAADPRLRCWSARLVLPADVDAGAVVENSVRAAEGSYSAVRYGLGIPEGVLDLPVGDCLPLECNGALLNGISFNKGCYLGQELTARTYHTGVVRKRLMPIRVDGDTSCAPNSFLLTTEGQQVGRLRGLVDGRGLGLLRLSALTSGRLTLRCAETGRESLAFTHVPVWWPAEVGVKLEEADSDV